MDDDCEVLSLFKELCPQCLEADWGISEDGQYYCRSCHTLTDKTRYIEDDFSLETSQVRSISRGSRKRKQDVGWEWYICEGFQFILLKQAEALEALGVGSELKNEVLCNMWRLYLRKCKQAYCKKPLGRMTKMPVREESTMATQDMVCESIFGADITSESEASTGLPSSGEPQETLGFSGDESFASVPSGSVDGGLYVKKGIYTRKLSMPLTLAFCYLSLLWIRSSITLSDLLRLAFYNHFPYYNAKQYFPEKTKLYGPDAHIFEVQEFPDYNSVLKLTHELGNGLQLSQFPQIVKTCYYHPDVLCIKYMMEVNLPDKLYDWTFSVTREARLHNVDFLTYDPGNKKARLIPYDILAVAIIIVTLKLVFGLNDETEWELADEAEKLNETNQGTTVFDFKKWYMTMKPYFDDGHRELEEEQASFGWEGDKVLSYNRKTRVRVARMKRMAGNLRNQFSNLADAAPTAKNQRPSSFLFNWEEQNTGKICFYRHTLEGIAQKQPMKKTYWLNNLQKCKNQLCDHKKYYDESLFPSSYRFVISLFSLILRVEPRLIHYEVGLVEEQMFKDFPEKKSQIKRDIKTMKAVKKSESALFNV